MPLKKIIKQDPEKALADLIAKWARNGAATGIDCGKMCDECAFRTGSAAQSEPHNVSAAATALAYEGIFNCHINGFENAGHPCAGFLYAKAYFETEGCSSCGKKYNRSTNPGGCPHCVNGDYMQMKDNSIDVNQGQFPID
jgi:hypothetical protein